MYWLEVCVKTDGEAAEAISEALRPFAHDESVVLEQQGDMNDLDPYALEPEVSVKIYIAEDNDSPELRLRIAEIIYFMGRLYPVPAPTFRKIDDEDWSTSWKENYQPFRIGKRLWIQPSWLDPAGTNPDDIMLTLDPGMAFGTGTHPTTQMCLQALERYVEPNHALLDVGTGSGILSIAAAKLGAGQIVGVDTDPIAIRTAQENAEKNGVAEAMQLSEGELASVSQKEWDLVVVNILAPVIILLLTEHDLMGYVAPAGKLILSGIIDEQLDDVVAALKAAGGQVVEKFVVRDWVALICSWNSST